MGQKHLTKTHGEIMERRPGEKSLRSIADLLGYSPAAISREVRRNAKKNGRHDAQAAQRRAACDRNFPKNRHATFPSKVCIAGSARIPDNTRREGRSEGLGATFDTRVRASVLSMTGKRGFLRFPAYHHGLRRIVTATGNVICCYRGTAKVATLLQLSNARAVFSWRRTARIAQAPLSRQGSNSFFREFLPGFSKVLPMYLSQKVPLPEKYATDSKHPLRLTKGVFPAREGTGRTAAALPTPSGSKESSGNSCCRVSGPFFRSRQRSALTAFFARTTGRAVRGASCRCRLEVNAGVSSGPGLSG